MNPYLRFDESQINEIASRYVYPREETELTNLRDEIQRKGYIDKQILQLVAIWKAPRSAGHINKNTNEYIKEISSFSFATCNERARIQSLTNLDGVSWPTASVILHLFHNNPYPILDFRAIWSINLDEPKQYKYSYWKPYVKFCCDLAQTNNVSMRILDRALWQYSKENQ